MIATIVFDKIFMTQDFYDSLTKSIDKVVINRWEDVSPSWYGYDVIISEDPVRDACHYKVDRDPWWWV